MPYFTLLHVLNSPLMTLLPFTVTDLMVQSTELLPCYMETMLGILFYPKQRTVHSRYPIGKKQQPTNM